MKKIKTQTIVLLVILLAGLLCLTGIATADDTYSISYDTGSAVSEVHGTPNPLNLVNGTSYPLTGGSLVVIGAGGEYVLEQGDFANVTIRITTSDPVILVLNGTNITNLNRNAYQAVVNTSPLQLMADSDVTLVLVDGSENSFTSGSASGSDLTMQAGIFVNPTAELTIRGQTGNSGKLTAIGGAYSAGIGGGPNGKPGNITIEGGIITAESYPSGTGTISRANGAGIGSGGGNTSATNASTNEIVIRGKANVTAISHENGAGIGGGGNNANVAGTGGIIKIYGDATVTATGELNGAGIGGGGTNVAGAGAGGTIEISGNANVSATSITGTAIGGGSSGVGTPGAGGTIIIDGNPIITTTISNSNAYNIGPGVRGATPGTEGTITIDSGNIYAGKTSTVENSNGIALEMIKVTPAEIPDLLANEKFVYNVTDPTRSYDYTATTSGSNEAYLWLPVGNYFIVFDTDGGIPIPDVHSVPNTGFATVYPPFPHPIKIGFDFIHWGISGSPYNFASPVTSDLTITAYYIPKTHTVTFYDSDGINVIGTDTVAHNTVVSPITAPVKAGFDFNEWQVGGAQYDFTDLVTSDLNIIADYTAVAPHTITFEDMGGNAISTVSVTHNTQVSAITPPVEPGFEFNEWQVGGAQYDFTDLVTSDLTIIADYTAVPDHTVTFEDGSGNVVSAVPVTHNTPVSAITAPIQIGFDFNEWRLGGTAYNFATNVTADLTIIANYTTIADHTVTFDSDGGTAIAPKMVAHHDVTTAPTNPTKSGHTFIEWQEVVGGIPTGTQYTFIAPITANVDLIAIYTVNPSGGGSGTGSATITNNTGGNNGSNGNASNGSASVRIEVVCIDENGNELYVQSLAAIVGNSEVITAPSIEGYMLVLNEKSSQEVTIVPGENVITFTYTKIPTDVQQPENNTRAFPWWIIIVILITVITIYLIARKQQNKNE